MLILSYIFLVEDDLIAINNNVYKIQKLNTISKTNLKDEQT